MTSHKDDSGSRWGRVRSVAFWGAVCLLLDATPSAAQGPVQAVEGPPPEVGVRVHRLKDVKLIEAVLPGEILDLSVPVPGIGGTAAVLLAPEEDPEGPRVVYRFDPSGHGSLVLLADDLPADSQAIGRLAQQQDREEWVVGEPGKIYSLGSVDDPRPGSRLRVLLEAPHLDLASVRRHRLMRPARTHLFQPRLGQLEVFGGGDETMELIETLELPVRADRTARGLRLSTPPLYLLDRPAADLPWIAVGPERHGQRRLLTTLIDPFATGEPEAGPAEAWSRLNANERVAQSWYFTVDDRPILVVAALDDDKLSLLERKKLRVFSLRTDRTRAGTPPSLELITATRHWYDVGVDVVDFDLDGRQDLLIVQPAGLGAKNLAVEVYRGKGNGGFFSMPRRSMVVAPDAHWIFREDLSGDRIPDLVALDSRKRLQVFTGLAGKGRKLLSKTPRWEVSLKAGEAFDDSVEVELDAGEEGESDTRPERLVGTSPLIATDFDGDGRGEVLVRSRAEGVRFSGLSPRRCRP